MTGAPPCSWDSGPFSAGASLGLNESQLVGVLKMREVTGKSPSGLPFGPYYIEDSNLKIFEYSFLF